jgi:hypothetical protein
MGFHGDLEKQHELSKDAGGVPTYMKEDGGFVPGESFEIGDSLYAKLQRLAGRYGVEQRGIERVPDSEKTEGHTKGLLNVATMVNCPRWREHGIPD